MSYFSQLSIAMGEREPRLPDKSYPTEDAELQFHLEDLMARYDELNEIRPHDPLHPLYDRYFYEDHLTHYYETPCTMQGLLKAIAEVKQLIKSRLIEKTESDRFLAAIEATGAAPDGQLVIISLFAPFLSKSIIPA